MKENGVSVMIVSPLLTSAIRNNSVMVNSLLDAGVKIFMVPDEQEWDGKSDIKAQMMREIEIEDLLPREKIEVDMDAIGSLLRGRRILITGAAGSIGSEIVRQVSACGPSKLVLIDQAETPFMTYA